MLMDIKNYCKKYEQCAVSKITPPKVLTGMGHLTASEPPECVAIDFYVLEVSTGVRKCVDYNRCVFEVDFSCTHT